MKAELDKGFDCQWCGKHHEFGAYVAAHWVETLTHTCDCGAEHTLRSGYIALTKNGGMKHK